MVAMGSSSDVAVASAQYRYAAVFVLTLTLLVFVIVAPNADWSRAVALSLESAALVVAIATSRAGRAERRARTAVVAGLGVLAVIGVGVGVLGPTTTAVVSGALAVAIPLSLVRGLLRLVTVHGVTLQAVAGALAIYLLIGLLFAWVIGFIVQVDPSAYFANGTDGTESERVYFSLSVLTTTGFGDFTAGQPIGRALAVLEMLVGQLYLVTVIGLMIGNFAARRMA
jgi:hypothetical protein